MKKSVSFLASKILRKVAASPSAKRGNEKTALFGLNIARTLGRTLTSILKNRGVSTPVKWNAMDMARRAKVLTPARFNNIRSQTGLTADKLREKLMHPIGPPYPLRKQSAFEDETLGKRADEDSKHPILQGMGAGALGGSVGALGVPLAMGGIDDIVRAIKIQRMLHGGGLTRKDMKQRGFFLEHRKGPTHRGPWAKPLGLKALGRTNLNKLYDLTHRPLYRMGGSFKSNLEGLARGGILGALLAPAGALVGTGIGAGAGALSQYISKE